MVDCARCGHIADDLRIITPDVVTKELVVSIDDSEGNFAGEGELKVCAECMDELMGD